MRKYLRAMAHHAMEQDGVLRINKKKINPKTGTRTEPSYFASNWRRVLKGGD